MGISPQNFADRLIVLLPKLSQEISRNENNYITRGHITCQQFATLDLIAQQEQWKMRDFVNSTDLGFSSVTGMVDRLVNHGLVRRTHGKEDRRTVWISATTKGRKIIDQVYKQKKDGIIHLFQRLSSTERQNYLDILEKLVINLSATKGGSS